MNQTVTAIFDESDKVTMKTGTFSWSSSFPVSQFEFAADRPCNYVSYLATGQSVRRVEERATPPINLSFSFLSRVSRHLI